MKLPRDSSFKTKMTGGKYASAVRSSYTIAWQHVYQEGTATTAMLVGCQSYRLNLMLRWRMETHAVGQQKESDGCWHNSEVHSTNAKQHKAHQAEGTVYQDKCQVCKECRLYGLPWYPASQHLSKSDATSPPAFDTERSRLLPLFAAAILNRQKVPSGSQQPIERHRKWRHT